MSTGDKEAPGNNGLKDQVLALRWIKENIEAFGGDPNSITLYGYNAGGVSATLHLISPMSKGLFHKVIISGGSALGQWPIEHNQMNMAKKLAKAVGCPDDTSANIIKCLKGKPANELGQSQSKLAVSILTYTIDFVLKKLNTKSSSKKWLIFEILVNK